MKHILFFCLLGLFAAQSDAQFARQKASLYTYTIGFSALTTGLGRALNKPKGESFGHAFRTGVWQGCIGGAFMIGGKELSYQVKRTEQLAWSWPARLMHSYGVSILENSSTYRKAFASLRFPVGFIMLDLSLTNKLLVRPRLQPGSLYSFCYGVFHNQINLKKTAQMGVPYFEYQNRNGQEYRAGSAGLNTVFVNTSYDYQGIGVPAHELVHLLQFREYLVFNTYFEKAPLLQKLKEPDGSTVKWIARYIYPDIPYYYLPYDINRKTANSYLGNLYELEAEHYSQHRFIGK